MIQRSYNLLSLMIHYLHESLFSETLEIRWSSEEREA